MSSRRTINRRRFLRGMGGAVVSLPLLSTGLGPNHAFAQGAEGANSFPKRFIFMIHPNGVVHDTWFPTLGDSGEETDFTLNSTFTDLGAYKDRLIFLENVDHEVGNWDRAVGPGEPHQKGMGGILTGRTLNEGQFVGGDGSRAGWGSGISVDQVLANKIGADTALGSLAMGVRADSHIGSEVRSRISYVGSNQPNPPLNDPVKVFDQLFSDMNTSQGAMDDIRARRGSVLDSVASQLESVYARAGYEDRQSLDRHLTMVRDLENRLAAEGGSCGSTPDRPEDLVVDSEDTMPKITRNHIDLMTMALACDLTRVATIQFSNSKNGIRFPWIDSLGDGHGLSHAGPSNANAGDQLRARDRWHAQQFKYILDRLDSIPEGDGTLLDNTVVIWTSEISVGNTHSHRNLPIVMAGSAGGYFDTGRYVTYQTTRSTNDLLVSVLNAFGEDVTTFGESQYCNGPLSGLT